jgi:tripartite-type tricarboxylate transporter receptor subunit TctC
MRANIPAAGSATRFAPPRAAWLPRAAHAQSFPNRFVRLIVPFPPGGGGDALARPLAQRLSEVWGQQVIVENRGGAGGNVGAYQAANAPPDGYTLLLGAAYLSINPALYPTSGYNPSPTSRRSVCSPSFPTS